MKLLWNPDKTLTKSAPDDAKKAPNQASWRRAGLGNLL